MLALFSILTVRSKIKEYSKPCQMCLMTFDYYLNLKKNNPEEDVSTQMKDVCTLFDARYHDICYKMIKSQTMKYKSFNPVANTTQEFCYSLYYCDSKGPSKKLGDMTISSVFNKVSENIKTTLHSIGKKLQEL